MRRTTSLCISSIFPKHVPDPAELGPQTLLPAAQQAQRERDAAIVKHNHTVAQTYKDEVQELLKLIRKETLTVDLTTALTLKFIRKINPIRTDVLAAEVRRILAFLGWLAVNVAYTQYTGEWVVAMEWPAECSARVQTEAAGRPQPI